MGSFMRSIADFGGGLVAGFAFGVVAGLLVAPREGEETRALLADTADDALHKPREVVDDLQSRVNRAIAEGRQAAADARAEMESAAGLGRVRRSADGHRTASADVDETVQLPDAGSA